MKAVVTTKYGSPEVLHYQDVPKPAPKDKEVLIKVRAASVGPSDTAFRKGDPFIVKLIYGLRKPKYDVMGTEFAGEIAGVGKEVTRLRVGDAVMGMSPHTFGAHAEYMVLAEREPLVMKSAGMSFEQAAALCDGGPTALTFIRDVAKVRAGQKVLVNGASGAVGSAGVQLAKYYGAEVTGVCSTANVEMVKALGADHVVDYTTTDFTKSAQRYDVIFDAVGKSSFGRCKRILTPNGIYMNTVPGLGLIFSLLTTMFGRKKAKFATAGLVQNNDNLTFLRDLFDAGHLCPVIDRRYALSQAADAHRYVETGHKKGNVVVAAGT